mmetsp:Transcript_894/g.1355  ORF Transcript_894/g.1355 Transcript_894/m.1355 type:complete len:100 (+) Transcript_894:644-943(+)
MKLYETFKHEDFVHKIWDENGIDRNLDSERALNVTQQSLGQNTTGAGNTQPGLMRQETRTIREGVSKVSTSLINDEKALSNRRNTVISAKSMLSNDMQR